MEYKIALNVTDESKIKELLPLYYRATDSVTIEDSIIKIKLEKVIEHSLLVEESKIKDLFSFNDYKFINSTESISIEDSVLKIKLEKVKNLEELIKESGFKLGDICIINSNCLYTDQNYQYLVKHKIVVPVLEFRKSDKLQIKVLEKNGWLYQNQLNNKILVKCNDKNEFDFVCNKINMNGSYSSKDTHISINENLSGLPSVFIDYHIITFIEYVNMFKDEQHFITEDNVTIYKGMKCWYYLKSKNSDFVDKLIYRKCNGKSKSGKYFSSEVSARLYIQNNLLFEAKEKYPVGTRFKSLSSYNSNKVYTVGKTSIMWNNNVTPNVIVLDAIGVLYSEGIWAEIITDSCSICLFEYHEKIKRTSICYNCNYNETIIYNKIECFQAKTNLANTRIHIGNRTKLSELVQKKAFSLNWWWNNKDNSIKKVKSGFIYFSQWGSMLDRKDYGENRKYVEILPEDLNIYSNEYELVINTLDNKKVYLGDYVAIYNSSNKVLPIKYIEFTEKLIFEKNNKYFSNIKALTEYNQNRLILLEERLELSTQLDNELSKLNNFNNTVIVLLENRIKEIDELLK